MLSFFSSDTPPPERRHKVLDRAQRRIKGVLRRSSVWGELAWNRLVHSVLLVRGPLSSHSVLQSLAALVVAVLLLTVGLWLTDRWHGLPTAVVALLPAIAFTATGVLDQTDVDSLEWDILILIGGGIALGTGMQRTGLDQIVVQAVPLEGPFVLAGLVGATVLVSTFMSNTAAANLLIPIGVSFALRAPSAGGAGPVQIGLCIALAASLSMALPVSTPPNAIAYASGELDTSDFVRAGGLLGGLAVVLIVAFGGAVIGFWIG